MAKKVEKPVVPAKKAPVKTKAKTATKAVPTKRVPQKAATAKPVKKINRVGDEAVPVIQESVAVTYPTGTGRIELWAYDEYNQGSIVFSGTDIEKIVARAKQFVTEQNVDNALASAEKNNTWEAYFPIFFTGGKQNTNMLYGGNKRDGKHYAYTHTGGKWVSSVLPKGTSARFFLGMLNNGRVKSEWFLSDHKNAEITTFDAQALERKTVLFVKIV